MTKTRMSLSGIAVAAIACGGNIHLGPAPYKSEVMADRPVLYLRFGEVDSQVAKDEIGAHDGQYPASGISLGEPGALMEEANTAIRLSGTSVVTMPAGFDFPGAAPFSIEAWVKPTVYDGQSLFGFVVDHSTRSPRESWSLRVSADEVALERWEHDSTFGSTATWNAALRLGEWHHVVSTFDGANLALYVDGVRVALNGAVSQMPPMKSTWTIGGPNCECSSNYFVGALDEFAIYDKALPPSRVTAHFAAAGR